MLIDGPFTISMMEKEDSTGYELHLELTEAFRGLSLSQQGERARDYVSWLRGRVAAGDVDERERQGMLTILQIVEQLTPHLVAGEIPLEETITVTVQPDNAIAIPAAWTRK
jgi:hypothetical protein